MYVCGKITMYLAATNPQAVCIENKRARGVIPLEYVNAEALGWVIDTNLHSKYTHSCLACTNTGRIRMIIIILTTGRILAKNLIFPVLV